MAQQGVVLGRARSYLSEYAAAPSSSLWLYVYNEDAGASGVVAPKGKEPLAGLVGRYDKGLDRMLELPFPFLQQAGGNMAAAFPWSCLVSSVRFSRACSGLVLPKSCARMFLNFRELQKVEGLKWLNWDQVSNVSYMFAGCRKMETIPPELYSLTLSQVKCWRGLFNDTKINKRDIEAFASAFRAGDILAPSRGEMLKVRYPLKVQQQTATGAKI